MQQDIEKLKQQQNMLEQKIIPSENFAKPVSDTFATSTPITEESVKVQDTDMNEAIKEAPYQPALTKMKGYASKLFNFAKGTIADCREWVRKKSLSGAMFVISF